MRLLFSLFFCCWVMLPLSVAWGQLTQIGTGGVSGVYYPVGGQLSLLFNKQVKQDEFTLFFPKVTGGTEQNIEELLSGEVQFALAQSNLVTEAYQTGVTEDKKEQALRTVFSLYPEFITIVAGKDVEVNAFSDLKNKRIAIGSTNSGSLSDTEHILSALTMSFKDFRKVSQYTPNDAVTALCYGDVDAVILTVGHPSSNVFRMLGQCQGKLIPFSEDEVRMVTKKYPAYSDILIPNNTYRAQVEVRTLGLYSLFITRADLSEALVYQLTKQVFEHLDSFKASLPVLHHLEKKLMAMQHFNIPIHPGAKKYFSERGFYH